MDSLSAAMSQLLGPIPIWPIGSPHAFSMKVQWFLGALRSMVALDGDHRL